MDQRAFRYRRCLAGATLLLTASSAAVALPPLNPVERAQLARLATGVPWVGPVDPVDSRRASPARHPLGTQTLLITLADGKHARRNAERTARVFQFDHDHRQARRLDVVLPGARLLRSVSLSSVHLPLNERERRWARARLDLARVSPGEAGRWSAFVHEPLSGNDACRFERCALLSLHGADGAVLDAEWVVHFDDGQVRALLPAVAETLGR